MARKPTKCWFYPCDNPPTTVGRVRLANGQVPAPWVDVQACAECAATLTGWTTGPGWRPPTAAQLKRNVRPGRGTT